MAQLSPQQIAQLAYNAGFRGSALRMAVAIALAESSGNPRAYNPETAAGTPSGSGSRGLWQIYGKAHPEFNTDRIYDPQLNAIAAFKVYREAGNSFRPWSTFKNGSANRIAQSLNINTSSESLKQQAPLLLSATGGGAAGFTGLAGSPQAMSEAYEAASAGAAGASGLFNIQLLPENITQAISSPDFPKTIIVAGMGVLLFVIGFVILIVQLVPGLAGGVTKVVTKAALSGAIEGATE